MDAREIMRFLETHPAGNVFAFGVVRQDESVLAFGVIRNDEKVRMGSITSHDVPGDEHFLVLSYPDSAEEFRASSLSELGWFLWKLSGSDWEQAENWCRDDTANNNALNG